MIYRRQTIKELSASFIGTFFILLIILFSIQLVNLLGQVARGVMSLSLFTGALAVALVDLLPFLLCITCFISILKVFSRYWIDSEMVIWSASGLKLKNWINPVLFFATPFILLLFVLTLYVLPVVHKKSFEYTQLVKAKPSLSFIEPGVFLPIHNGVIFLEDFNRRTNELNSFFSHEVDTGSPKFEITLAKKGVIQLKDGGIKMTLWDARRYLGYPNQADFSVFDIPKAEYYVQTNQASADGVNLAAQKDSLTTASLWHSKDPLLQGTLMWRFSLPIAAFVLALLAIPLSYRNNRSNRNYNIVIAILFFFLYQNGLIWLRNLVVQGHIGWFTALCTLPIAMLLVTYFLFHYRSLPQGNLKLASLFSDHRSKG
ncbi:MAG: LPS export ABC transporter permease LptF [Neisseriaceae bacterium]